MYTTKESAAAAGELRYFTNRPCKRGHTGPRYTSSGNCIECVSNKAKQNKIRMHSVRIISNSKRAQDQELFASTCPIDWHDDMRLLVSIARSNDTSLQAKVRAAMRGCAVEWDRDAFLRAGVIFNGQFITNAANFTVGTPFSIRIGGIWWPGPQLLACLRGDIPSVAPCAYTPRVEE